MKIGEANFREIHRHFIAVKDDKVKKDIEEYRKLVYSSDCDSSLMFCYIDHDAGLTFDYICPYNSNENKIYEISNKDFRWMYRKGNLNESEMKIIPYDLINSDEIWEDVKRIVENYESDEDVNETRKITDIDHLREKDFPDDILVYLYKENVNSERVWVRLTSFKEGILVGKLLNEPLSDFGVHIMDTIKIDHFRDEKNVLNAIYMSK